MTGATSSTRAALVAAAAIEFELVGYEHTNTNAIARRAGYAPQTFYRHFKDKLAIFLAVYEQWTQDELRIIVEAGSTDELVAATLAQHNATKLFRRTLRDLTVRAPDVAEARAASRRRQLDGLRDRAPDFAKQSPALQAGALLTFERLCDALVEGEFERLGVDMDEAVRLLANLIRAYAPDDLSQGRRRPG